MTEETIKEILKFRDDRDWKQFHNPKDLAISISLEAAEIRCEDKVNRKCRDYILFRMIDWLTISENYIMDFK